MSHRSKATDLVEVRDFLARHGCAPAPWEAAPRVVERLHEALCERRTDGRFWTELEGLVARLEDRRFDRAALRGSQALSEATLGQMFDELRLTLDGGRSAPGGGGPDGGRRGWLKPMSGAALLMFLVLGAAVGCNEEKRDEKSDGLCAQAKEQNLTGHEGDVYCELTGLIRSSSIPAQDKYALYACLPELDAAYREQLLDMFEEMSDAELAAALENLVNQCQASGDDDNDDNDNDNDDNDDDTAGH